MTTKSKLPRWYVGPRGQGQYDLNVPAQYKAWEAAWAEAYPKGVAGDSSERGSSTAPDDRDGTREPIDDSPEARAERAERQRRQAEAVAYVASYTGSWGLPLDLRSDRRWGTKHLRLSERQVDALLAGRDRDAARAAQRDPKQDEIVARVVAQVKQLPESWLPNGSRVGVPDFVSSIVIQHGAGKALSERQLAAIDRWAIEKETLHARPQTGEAPGLAAQRPGGTPVAGGVTEGWYLVDGQPWKVQHTRENHSRLYAKRLVLGDPGADRDAGDRVGPGRWDYVPGGLTVIAQKGTRMTVDEAAAFGKLHGVCAVCGRELTDETSIARGIGPVCFGRLAG